MKKIRLISMAAISIIIIFTFAFMKVNDFNNAIINGPITDGKILEEDYSTKKITYEVQNKKGCNISKIFCFENKSQLQIRFRCFSVLPFLNENIMQETAFELTNSKGESLNYAINVYQEKMIFSNGLNVILIFNNDYLPEKGEVLTLEINSYSESNVKNETNKYLYAKIILNI